MPIQTEPLPPGERQVLIDLKSRLDAARAEEADAYAALNRAILVAADHGCGLADIGAAVHLTKARVHQIVTKARGC